MDDDIPPQADEFSYTDDPAEEINVVFRRKSIEDDIQMNDLAFGTDKFLKKKPTAKSQHLKTSLPKDEDSGEIQ